MTLFTSVSRFRTGWTVSQKIIKFAGFSQKYPCIANFDLPKICLLCHSQIHTSCVNLKRRKTPEERKSTRIFEFPKSKGDLVGVWKGITLEDLTKVLKKDLNYVREIFLFEIKNPKMPINDMKFLQNGIRRSGKRMLIIAKPTNEDEEIIEKDIFPRPPASKSELKARPPVVTVMGHVDHGKTTLLDALRNASVVDQEFGGITQHIGAFSVALESGAKITFLDTPGHAAFTSMRARGASVTDIVVLVVAADDGVMEQTIESIRMAKEAKVPILVAINKIDAPKADIDATEQMLMQAGIQTEKYGGDVQAVPISALKKQNLNQLIEALVLQAELLEVGADPTGPVEAVIVESRVDVHRGRLSTVIVQRGTLKKGNILVAGTALCKVRVLLDANGKILQEVPPGYPAEIEGWKDLPSPGDVVLQVDTEQKGREVIKVRQEKIDEEKMEEDAFVISEKQSHHEKEYKEKLELKRRLGRYKMRREGPRTPEIPKDENPNPTLNIIVKSDVDGTLEALLQTIDTYNSPDCKLDVIHSGVGPVTETDVELAQAFNGVIYTFNVNCPPKVKQLAEEAGLPVKPFNVIYKLIDDIKEEINAKLPEKEVEEALGEATVLQQFEINQGRKKIPVAGCRCVKGMLRKSANFKIVRNDEVVHVGRLSSMRHLKDEVDTVKTDLECGLQLADKEVSFHAGDTIICFQLKKVRQTTNWDPGF